MGWAILGLMAGFVVVLVLLYVLLLKTRLAVGYKVLALVVCTVFYWVQYQSLHQYTGWPSTDKLPDEFILIATDIHEPNKKTGQTGVMYWWVRDSDKAEQLPRVYQLPYQAQLHKKTEQVLKEQKQGGQYLGKKIKTADHSQGLGFEKISKANRLKKKPNPEQVK